MVITWLKNPNDGLAFDSVYELSNTAVSLDQSAFILTESPESSLQTSQKHVTACARISVRALLQMTFVLTISAIHFALTLFVGVHLGTSLMNHQVPSTGILAICCVVQVLLSARHATSVLRIAELSENRLAVK